VSYLLRIQPAGIISNWLPPNQIEDLYFSW